MGVVVVIGSINMDLVVSVPRLPHRGETVLGGSFTTAHGGKGANQAVAAARAGAEVRMIGRVGADAYGIELRGTLTHEGIDVTNVGTAVDDPSGIALITVSAAGDGGAGENTIAVAAGANSTLHPEDVDRAGGAGVFDGAAVLVAQLEVPMDSVLHAAERAVRAGVLFVLNPSPVQPLSDELLALVDALLVNETELEALGGMTALRAKVPAVVFTRGSHGLEVHDAEGVLAVEPHRVAAIDSTGAGDACCGAIAAALAAGTDLRTAAVRGNAAGAWTATLHGARTSPTAVQIDSMLNR